MKNTMKLNGLKKAVGDYKRYNEGGYYSPEYGLLYFDAADGSLWTNYYNALGHGSYTRYESDTIVNLGRMMKEQGLAVTMANVKEFIANNF